VRALEQRLALVLAVSAAALVAVSAAAAVTSAAPRIARGSAFHITLTTQSVATCTPFVSYSDAGLQLGTQKKATDGHVAWAIPVARSRPLGRATWYVRCGIGVERSGAFTVVKPASAG
jgi:hypothetical protein